MHLVSMRCEFCNAVYHKPSRYAYQSHFCSKACKQSMYRYRMSKAGLGFRYCEKPFFERIKRTQ